MRRITHQTSFVHFCRNRLPALAGRARSVLKICFRDRGPVFEGVWHFRVIVEVMRFFGATFGRTQRQPLTQPLLGGELSLVCFRRIRRLWNNTHMMRTLRASRHAARNAVSRLRR